MQKYIAISFSGKKQINHIQESNFSGKIEKFITENEEQGFDVLIDFKESGNPIRQVYKTKK